VRNIVADVELLKGDFDPKSWEEGRPAIRHRLSAVASPTTTSFAPGGRRATPNYIVSGRSPHPRSRAEEIVDFRSAGQGRGTGYSPRSSRFDPIGEPYRRARIHPQRAGVRARRPAAASDINMASGFAAGLQPEIPVPRS